MIEKINTFDKDIVGFRIDGRVDKSDIDLVYDTLDSKTSSGEKIKAYMEVKNLSLGDISWAAIKEELSRIFKNPSSLVNLSKAAIVTDIPWLKPEFAVERAFIPTLEGETFHFGEEDKAVEWLRTDQRASQRLDLTESEMTQVAFFKSAAGFGLGLLAASLFTKEQRRNLGLGVLLGSVIFSLPISIKVLNNNRQLLEK
jgi:SpoIIAA-like